MLLTYMTVERKKQGLTQKQLANILGISEPYVCMLEKKKETPGQNLEKRLENFFNKSINYLMTEIIF